MISRLLCHIQALAAEVTSTFSHRLSPLNVTVRELTGDMQLSKYELDETQVFFFSCHSLTISETCEQQLNVTNLYALLDDSDNSREMGCDYPQEQ